MHIKVKNGSIFTFLYIGLILLTVSGCGSSRSTAGGGLPPWVDNPSASYSESRYLMAVGSGSSLDRAHENALGNLARIFQAEITASRQLIDEFVETAQNDNLGFEQTSRLLNITRVGSQQDLINTRILISELATNGTYYALAGMNRLETSRIYNQEITTNELQINEYESNTEDETELLNRLILLKKALILAEVNENLARQRNILMGGASDRALNTVTLNRIRENFRGVQQQVPVAVVSDSAPNSIIAAITAVFQREGFLTTSDGTAVLEVTVDYRYGEADLNREETEFVQWELIIDILNKNANRSFNTYITGGRDGAFSYNDAVMRASASAREQIDTDFRQFLSRELFAFN